MKSLRTWITVAATAAALVAPATVLAAPASAATARNGVCETGEFCLYYNTGPAGSLSDFTTSVSDYGDTQPGCYDFKGAGSGKGLCVKNNAAGAKNLSSKTVRVYYNSGYDASHAYQDFAPGAVANFTSTMKNQNAGHQFLTATTRVNMSYGLYNASGGRITCGFDGYTTTPGRHEGIDIARSLGSSVHALVGGTVINVARGYTGSNGLSTIAVYIPSLDKTVIYLHTSPSSSLATGQTISRGQVIATESWHGVSSSGAAHTHVEMRLGRQTLAAKSVNDYTLSNPNPTSFWNSQNYNVN